MVGDHENEKIALEARETAGERLFSPSTARNRDPIREVFLRHMTNSGAILEIGSGTGEHAVHIASAAADIFWMPGDPDAKSRRSIAAWIKHAGLTNIAPPHAIDVTNEGWTAELSSIERDDAKTLAGIVSINMIHIAPFSAAQGLIAGAGKLLTSGGRVFLYGPFSRNGAHISDSNARFDEDLKRRNPAWGVRDLEGQILPLAEKAGLTLATIAPMPANNFSVILQKL